MVGEQKLAVCAYHDECCHKGGYPLNTKAKFLGYADVDLVADGRCLDGNRTIILLVKEGDVLPQSMLQKVDAQGLGRPQS